MRVLLVASIFPPDIGGPATYVRALAEDLWRRGHEVRVVTLSDRPDDAPVLSFPVDRIARGKNRLTRVIRASWLLARTMRGFDVVYVHGLELPALALARLFRVPSVLKIVGDLAWERARNGARTRLEIDEFQNAWAGAVPAVMKALRSSYVRLAGCVVTPSRYLAEMVVGWGARPSKVTVVLNAPTHLSGPSLTRHEARSRLGLEGPWVLSAGRLVDWKGFDHLISALARLQPAVRLALAGDGPDEARLRALADRLRVADRVRFTGRLSAAGVALWMQAADVFALVSTYEGLSHVLLEARAAGTPVVASCCGGNPEVVRDEVDGLLVPPGQPELLAAALSRLLEDSNLRERLAAAARTGLDRFSWEGLVSQTLGVLEAAASSGEGRAAGGGTATRVAGSRPAPRILMLSLDRSLLDASSESFARHKRYSAAAGPLTAVVFSGGEGTCEETAALCVRAAGGGPRPWTWLRGAALALRLALSSRASCLTAQEPFFTGLAGWLVSCVTGTPLVVQCHFSFLENDRWLAEAPLRNRFLRAVGRFVLRRADRVRVVNEREAERVRRLRPHPNPPGEGVSVVSVPLETERLESGSAPARVASWRERLRLPAGVPAVVWIGRDAATKNVAGLLATAREVLAARPDARFVVVGVDPDAMRRRACCNPDPRIHVVETAGREDLGALLTLASVYLQTSLHEGFCRALAEACWMGVPVVSSATDGAAEILGETGQVGVLVPIGDDHAAGCEVLRLLSDRELAQTLGQAASQSVRTRFEPRRVEEQLLALWSGR